MKLSILITMDNAAFDNDNAGAEVARLLRELADRVEGAGSPAQVVSFAGSRLHDASGQPCVKIGPA